MPEKIKNIVLIGANREGLSLLPLLLRDTSRSKLQIIADPNKDAMLFKLQEMGYRIADKHNVKIARSLDALKAISPLHVIIDTVQNDETEKFLAEPDFQKVEKLGTLSAKLIWGTRATDGHEALLESLGEIVDTIRLMADRRELLCLILKLAIESTGADRGSIMILAREENVLRVEVAEGIDRELLRSIEVKLGEGISGKVARDGKPLMITGKPDSTEFENLKHRIDIRSALCVPLTVNGDVIGVMNVNSSESSLAFAEKDLKFLTDLSALASVVIHRSNEFERMTVDSAKLNLWREADFVMSSLTPLERRLDTICRKLADSIPGLTCFIYVYDEKQQKLVLKASSIKESQTVGALHLAAGEGIEGAGIHNRKDIILVDRVPDESTQRVYFSLPMVSEETYIGTFSVQVVSSGGVSVYQEALLKETRNMLSGKLYQKMQKDKSYLFTKKMLAVDEASVDMIGVRDPRRLMHLIVTSPVAVLGAEGGALRLRRDEASPCIITATCGLDDKIVSDHFLPIEKEAVMEVLRKKAPVNRVFSEETHPYIRAVLSHPLESDGKVIGAVTLFNKTDEPGAPPCGFSENDIEILSRFIMYAQKSLIHVFQKEVEKAPGEREVTDRPLPIFEKRAMEELNRSRRSGKSLALVTIHIAGLQEARIRDRMELSNRLLALLKKNVRNFDMMLWLDEETIGALLLDTDKKILRMLGALPAAISTEKDLYHAFKSGKVEVFYGHACFPNDGNNFGQLFKKACRRARVNFKGMG